MFAPRSRIQRLKLWRVFWMAFSGFLKKSNLSMQDDPCFRPWELKPFETCCWGRDVNICSVSSFCPAFLQMGFILDSWSCCVFNIIFAFYLKSIIRKSLVQAFSPKINLVRFFLIIFILSVFLKILNSGKNKFVHFSFLVDSGLFGSKISLVGNNIFAKLSISFL